jgi:hypothetical protein
MFEDYPVTLRHARYYADIFENKDFGVQPEASLTVESARHPALDRTFSR